MRKFCANTRQAQISIFCPNVTLLTNWRASLRRARNVSARTGRGRLALIWLRRGQRQPRGIVQNLPFLRRELVEAAGLDRTLARIRRHRPHAVNCVSDRLLSFRRQAVEL